MNMALQTRLLEVVSIVNTDATLSDEDRALLTAELALMDEVGRYHSCAEEGSMQATCKACEVTLTRLDAIAG